MTADAEPEPRSTRIGTRSREKTRAADSRANDIKGDIEALSHRYTDLERTCSERDARALSLGAELDELTRALVAEA